MTESKPHSMLLNVLDDLAEFGSWLPKNKLGIFGGDITTLREGVTRLEEQLEAALPALLPFTMDGIEITKAHRNRGYLTCRLGIASVDAARAALASNPAKKPPGRTVADSFTRGSGV